MNKFLNKRLQPDIQHPSSSIRSLKSIMNHSRVPLSQYINQRTSFQNIKQGKNGTNYFNKLKGMIHNNNYQNIEQQTSKEREINNQEVIKRTENQYLYQQSNTLNCRTSASKNQRKQSTSHKRKNNLSIKKNNKKDNMNQRINNMNSRINNMNQRISETSKKYRIKIQTNQITRKNRVMTSYQPNKTNTNQNVQQISQQQISKEKLTICQFNNSVEKIESHRRIIFENKQKFQTINYQQLELISTGHKLIDIKKVTISKVLGAGANTYVKLGEDQTTNIKYAIKIYQKYKLINPNHVKRVLKQITLLSKINHSNIISLIGAYQNKRQIHMLFQHIQNSFTLHQYLKSNSFSIDKKKMSFIITEIVKGLSYLHSLGISHRDIKTENILIGLNANHLKVKIIDFGFATRMENADAHCGTPNYMAPQLFIKGKQYNPQKVDMWALGVMIYYLIEGKYPYKGYNQKNLIFNINKQKVQFKKAQKNSKTLIKSLLNLDANQRPTSQQILNWVQNNQLFS